jgi:hypothetical protein
MTETHLPLPPKSQWGHGRSYVPMTRAEAEYWIASHNAWVEVWNRHERSHDLPLSPDWPEATTIGPIPKSVLAFTPRGQSRTGYIRMRSYQCWEEGWSYCRRPANAANIIWAGWNMSEAISQKEWDARRCGLSSLPRRFATVKEER